MSPRTMHRLVFSTVSPVVAFLVLAARPSADTGHVGGTYTMTYTQRHSIPVLGAEGHVIMATEASGTNRSTGPSPFEDGARVTIVETADITQGTGTHQGYVVVAMDSSVRVSRWSGKLTTVLGTDQKPSTSFKGTWISVKGPAGRGTYTGRITGPDSYTVEWAGELSSR